ncbi:MAG: hypothetical protein AAB426_00560 [Myxococcota bacterium]
MGTTLVVTCIASLLTAQARAGGCDKDTDCKGDRVCVAGECQAASASGQPVAEPRSGDRLAAVRDSSVGVQADVGGFVLYGPSVSLEFGSRAAFLVRARAIALGAVRRLTAGNNTVSAGDFGLGAGMRFYTGTQANREGFYLGPTAEYASTSEQEGDDLPTGVTVRYVTKAIILGADGGYRWVFPSGTTLGVGVIVGLYHPLSAETQTTGDTTYLSSWGDYTNDASDAADVLATVELGFAL